MSDERGPVALRALDGPLTQVHDLLAGMRGEPVLSHRSAAFVWGIWQPSFDGVEVTTAAGPRGSRYTTSVQQGSVVAHRRILAPADVTTRFALAVTTPERTWVDLAARLELPDLVAAGDCALRLGSSPSALAAAVLRARHARGVRNARAVLPLLSSRSRSRPESRIRAALVLAGLPCPQLNEPIHDADGGWLAEPDLLYREAKVALEYNGEDHAQLMRMRKDATRLLDMQRAGWEVRTYTAVDAFQRLDDVVADVRALLRVRAPQLLARSSNRRVTDSRYERRRRSRH